MHTTTLLLALVALLLSPAAILAAPAGQPSYPPPSQDPFYVVPKDIGKYKPGHVLRERAIDPTYFGPEAQAAYQLFYRTTAQDQPDGTVTTVVVPKMPARGNPRLLAIGQPEDSASINCAPSYSFVEPKKSNNTEEFQLDTIHYAALHQGWFVTIPDLEGSKSAFLAGRTEGPAILDGIRATLNYGTYLQNGKHARVALTGYSGGAHGTGWAAQLSGTYAPELNIVGWAAGGLPANVGQNFDYLDGGLGAGLDFLGSAGLSNAYPELRALLDTHALPNTTIAYEAMRNGTLCVTQEAFFANLTFSNSFTLPNISTSSVYQNVLQGETLGRKMKPLTRFPVMLVHSTVDMTVPYSQAAEYVKEQCAQGATINFVSLPKGQHTPVGVDATPSFVKQLKALFDGHAKADGHCTNGTALPVATEGKEAMKLMGPVGYKALLAVVNATGGLI